MFVPSPKSVRRTTKNNGELTTTEEIQIAGIRRFAVLREHARHWKGFTRPRARSIEILNKVPIVVIKLVGITMYDTRHMLTPIVHRRSSLRLTTCVGTKKSKINRSLMHKLNVYRCMERRIVFDFAMRRRVSPLPNNPTRKTKTLSVMKRIMLYSGNNRKVIVWGVGENVVFNALCESPNRFIVVCGIRWSLRKMETINLDYY